MLISYFKLKGMKWMVWKARLNLARAIEMLDEGALVKDIWNEQVRSVALAKGPHVMNKGPQFLSSLLNNGFDYSTESPYYA